MELSVIIPIYNTPKEKLKRCFESVNAIRSESYECILVDDGSNQETSEYLNKYAERNSHFRYIRKENGGVSSARNVGIERALGEYICFVDADDEIVSEVFEYFLSKANDDDIIFTDLIFINRDKQTLWKVCDDKEIIYEKLLHRIFKNGEINGPYCKFIKKSFIEQSKIRFRVEMVMAEDRVFLLDMLTQNPMMSYIDKVGYFYYREETSGRNRLQKYRDLFYSNYEKVYRKELVCISSFTLSSSESEFFKARAAELFISSIFNVTLELTEIGIRLQEMELEIINAANFIDIEDIKKINRKAVIKRELLLKKRWKTLRILAFVRRKYLRAKGLI